MLKPEHVYAVAFRAIVEPSGKLRECQIERSSGDTKVDAYTCALVMRRAKYSAALDPTGLPTFGVYRNTMQWWVGDGFPPKVSNADLELSVISLPKGVKSPALVQVMFAVDANGRVSSCALGPEAGRGSYEKDPLLIQAACEHVLTSFKAIPVKDGAGNFVPSMQNGTVRFITGTQR